MSVPCDGTPEVSAVILARNAAATLDAARDSLRPQTVSDWEVIVDDDGSTDHAATVAQAQTALEIA